MNLIHGNLNEDSGRCFQKDIKIYFLFNQRGFQSGYLGQSGIVTSPNYMTSSLLMK